MARNRMIKPEFWTDEKTGMLDAFEKCLFIGMLNFADDEGIVKANPLYLQSSIFPYDAKTTAEKVSKALCRLQQQELIFLYNKNNQHFAWIIKFRVHQRVDKPQKPQNPPPSIQNSQYHMAIFRRDGYVCHLCGEYTDTMDDRNRPGTKFPSIDHALPKSKGGTDYPTNLKTCCLSCNKSKKDKTTLEQCDDDSENIPGTFLEYSWNTPDQKKEKEKEKRIEKEKNIYCRVVTYLNEKTGKNFKHTSQKTQSLINARLSEHFTEADFITVIDNKVAKWLNDAKMAEFLRPETLFGTKFESYLNGGNNGSHCNFNQRKNGTDAGKDYSEYDIGTKVFDV
jgi:uncharacterized phage protein (TIGR02220 family)